MNYDSRSSIPLQNPQMMGFLRSMAKKSYSRVFVDNAEGGGSIGASEFFCNSTSLKRANGEDEMASGDPNFNVEQFFNAAPSKSTRNSET